MRVVCIKKFSDQVNPEVKPILGESYTVVDQFEHQGFSFYTLAEFGDKNHYETDHFAPEENEEFSAFLEEVMEGELEAV